MLCAIASALASRRPSHAPRTRASTFSLEVCVFFFGVDGPRVFLLAVFFLGTLFVVIVLCPPRPSPRCPRLGGDLPRVDRSSSGDPSSSSDQAESRTSPRSPPRVRGRSAPP